MLYKETTSPHTLELLSRLQKKDYLNGFYLAGGTALALQIGHRSSIDIDLFSNFGFNTGEVLENLSQDFDYTLFFSANNTLKGSINEIQVDILAHRYPYVSAPIIIDDITMLSIEDIIAMKLNAISVSGQRVKDFIDIYYMLDTYSIAEMVGFYKKKYASFNDVNVLKSLIWFEDIDHSAWPVLLKNPDLKWETIRKKIVKETQKFLRSI